MDLLVNEDTNDMVFINGACPTTTDKRSVVSQRLKISLQTFSGEWFMDTDVGIPYFQRVFGKHRSSADVDRIFQEAILLDPDVLELLTFYSEFDGARRGYALTFKVRTVDGSTARISISV